MSRNAGALETDQEDTVDPHASAAPAPAGEPDESVRTLADATPAPDAQSPATDDIPFGFVPV